MKFSKFAKGSDNFLELVFALNFIFTWAIAIAFVCACAHGACVVSEN